VNILCVGFALSQSKRSPHQGQHGPRRMGDKCKLGRWCLASPRRVPAPATKKQAGRNQRRCQWRQYLLPQHHVALVVGAPFDAANTNWGRLAKRPTVPIDAISPASFEQTINSMRVRRTCLMSLCRSLHCSRSRVINHGMAWWRCCSRETEIFLRFAQGGKEQETSCQSVFIGRSPEGKFHQECFAWLSLE
jgi:hypothetical protein